MKGHRMKQIFIILLINLVAIIASLIFKYAFNMSVIYTDVLLGVVVSCVAGLMVHNKWL